MKRFTNLIQQLSNSLNEEDSINKLVNYWNSCTEKKDHTFSIKLLLSITPKRKVTTKQLKEWASQITRLPNWIIYRSEEETNNFLQTFSLLLRSDYSHPYLSLAEWMVRISEISQNSNDALLGFIKEISSAPHEERTLLLKLLTGTFKSPISSTVVMRAMAEYLMASLHQLSLRFFQIGPDNLEDIQVLKNPVKHEDHLMPVPFLQIIPYEKEWSEVKGEMKDWKVYGKKEGIPAQIVREEGKIILWSQEGEILNDKFPEIINSGLAATIAIKIQGQLIPKDPAASLDTILSRLQKKSIAKKERQDHPANFEIWTSNVKKYKFGELCQKTGFTLIENIDIEHVEQFDQTYKKCRKLGFAGILLQKKNKTDTYLYKKASCFSIKAFLTYVELDNLNKTGLKFLSFGVLDENQEIIPIAKSDNIDKQVDVPEIIDFARQNTLERFGPVRTVKPELIFELHFDSIAESRRRKSGLALSNVIVFREINSSTATASTLEYLKKLLK